MLGHVLRDAMVYYINAFQRTHTLSQASVINIQFEKLILSRPETVTTLKLGMYIIVNPMPIYLVIIKML